MHDHHPVGADLNLMITVLIIALAVVAIIGYGWAATVARGRRRSGRRQSGLRRPKLWMLSWVAGAVAATAAVTGPLATAAQHSFTAHMISHLLLGMLAPLLLALARPVTVLLAALPGPSARRLSRVLRSLPIRIVTEPAVAGVLNVGGLWLLYTTNLYAAMHGNPLLHVLVHLHMFLAGYAFTVAIIDADPMPHRRSHRHRALVLVAALAAHDILAKYLYARPPAGVPTASAEPGAMIMYYGGDAVDIVLIVLLCAHWYRVTRPAGLLHPARAPAR